MREGTHVQGKGLDTPGETRKACGAYESPRPGRTALPSLLGDQDTDWQPHDQNNNNYSYLI